MKTLGCLALALAMSLGGCSKDEGGDDKDKDKEPTAEKPVDKDKDKDKEKEPDKDKPKPSGGDGPFAELGEYVNGAANATKSALLGKKVEGQWAESFPEFAKEKLNEVGQQLKTLGGAKHLVTAFELEATRPSGDPNYLRTLVAAMPDGKVGWLSVEARGGDPVKAGGCRRRHGLHPLC